MIIVSTSEIVFVQVNVRRAQLPEGKTRTNGRTSSTAVDLLSQFEDFALERY